MNSRALVIGAGAAGLTAAVALADLGIEVVVLEKEVLPGGRIREWDRLFPSRRPSREVLEFITAGTGKQIEIRYGIEVTAVYKQETSFIIHSKNSETISTDCILLATGFDLFDAHKKEEYGYGIYDNVITSAELEAVFQSGEKLTTRKGKVPERIGIIHCVGSRDEKVGNLYCSKVCCVTGVKQAIEIREMLPECEVFSFYMDLRMYDRNFEELYYEAQQKWGVAFIRGRLSECAENPDHSLILKTEDTLTGRPFKITVDLIVLLVGFVPRPGMREIARTLGLSAGTDGFLLTTDEHVCNNLTNVAGVFVAGAVKGPTSIVNAVADGKAAAVEAYKYLNSEW